MDDDFDLNIKKVDHYKSFEEQQQPRRKKKKKRDRRREDEAKDHFAELTKQMEQIHKQLQANNSPYRFCIYQEGDEVFIDLVILDERGKTKKTIKRDITHQEFSEIIKNIEKLDGIILNLTV